MTEFKTNYKRYMHNVNGDFMRYQGNLKDAIRHLDFTSVLRVVDRTVNVILEYKTCLNTLKIWLSAKTMNVSIFYNTECNMNAIFD